jgi:hypothetical protein
MALLVWTELVCGTCSAQLEGAWTSKGIDRRGLLKSAKQKGWIRFDDEVFCCEDCLEQHKNDSCSF